MANVVVNYDGSINGGDYLLIDNAANHGAEDGAIDVIVEPDGIIRVISTGVVVAPEVLAGLKRRFARGDTRYAGAGLGLAIVDTIMTQTDGTLELFSPAPGRPDGFEARIKVKTSR